MSTKKHKIIFDWPILHGAISTAIAKCGQKNCRCQWDPEARHGPYYRWTGKLDGKITTKTISKDIAEECEQRIKNYRKLQKKVDAWLKKGIDSVPWNDPRKK